MGQTQAQKDAAKAKRDAKKQEKLDAEKQAELDAKSSENSDGDTESADGKEAVKQYVPPAETDASPPAPPVKGTQFCSRYTRYRHRGYQFENHNLVIENDNEAAALKKSKAFGTDFWVCNKAG